MNQRILEFLRSQQGQRFHPMQIAQAVNATVPSVLEGLYAMRRLQSVKSWGPCYCNRTWSV